MDDGGIVVDELTEEECTELLGAHHFGRIGLVYSGTQLIFPVNYVFEDGRVAIRTAPGTKLAAAAQGHVAFEIDGIDETARTGWSVLVSGVGYEVTDAVDEASEDLRRFPVDTWAPGQRSHWIRVEPTNISGRRLRPTQG